jgi:hypothetical protein
VRRSRRTPAAAARTHVQPPDWNIDRIRHLWTGGFPCRQQSRPSETPTVVGRNHQPILFVGPIGAVLVLPGRRSASRFARHEGIRHDGEKYGIDNLGFDPVDNHFQLQHSFRRCTRKRDRDRLGVSLPPRPSRAPSGHTHPQSQLGFAAPTFSPGRRPAKTGTPGNKKINFPSRSYSPLSDPRPTAFRRSRNIPPPSCGVPISQHGQFLKRVIWPAYAPYGQTDRHKHTQ